ncbi:MAG: D-2-hydroxyacid dehydrogenase [Clostridia bacterium]|nr:D-2-hydroxyacid dehydrogenase [Clostridia bacterium]
MKVALDISAVTCGDIDFTPFEEIGEVVLFNEPTKAELYSLAADIDAIIVNKVPVDRDLLEHAQKLRYVGLFATGYNNIDLQACRERGIVVSNVPAYSTNAVTQHVFALLLCLLGKIPEYAASVQNGDWIRSKAFCYFPWPTYEISGKTFGIIGYGSIGRSVAKVADAFGARVIVNTRTKPADCQYDLVSKEEIFRTADIVSLHCPLTEQTAKLVNAETLAMMKPTAYLINAARGGLVDEPALAKALNEGHIAGAGVDTISEEPMNPANPLLGAKDCIITPHIAWVPHETRERLVQTALANLKAFLAGKPQNVVS